MHWFLDPIQNHYADFTGRASRQQFWMFTLWYFIIYIAVAAVAQLIGAPILGAALSLVLILPTLAIGARRLHDHGKSGWWQLVGIIPVVGIIIYVILMVIPSDAEENRFGAGVVGGMQSNSHSPTPSEIPDAAPETGTEVVNEASSEDSETEKNS